VSLNCGLERNQEEEEEYLLEEIVLGDGKSSVTGTA